MWPKALAQLVELAPHITRLVPLADRFFQSKTADSEANRKAMEAMAEGLRGDLGQVTAAHSGLYRQLNEQSEKLSRLAVEVQGVRASGEALDQRVALVEQKLTTAMKLLTASVVLNLGVLALLIASFFHHR